MKDMMTVGIVGLVVVMAMGLVVSWLRRPAGRGARGEKRVSRRLREGLPEEYLVVDDVYLPLEDGTTTQIDHIVVSRYGLFVVETKNYSGWIFGNERDAKWTQTFKTRKSQFQNPLRQNYRHVCAIADNLGIPKELLHGVVVFAGNCEFKTSMPANVVFTSAAPAYVLSFKSRVIEFEKVREIADALRSWDASVGATRKAAHVENLRRTHSRV